jgi:type I restriction enzyme, S subunit
MWSYLVRLKTDLNVAIPEYLNYWINSDRGQLQIQALATRAISQANLNPSTFCQHFKLPLPGRDRQQKAVRVLQAWDKGIGLATDLLAAAELRREGLMQQLLTGRQRLKGFKGTWPTVRVGSFAQDVRAINTHDLSLPVLSCTKYAGLVDSLRYFGKQVFSENTATYKIVRRGQFAYATNHIEEGSIGYQNLYDEALISPMYTVFNVDAAVVDHRYLYLLLKTEAMRRVFEATTHSSVDRRGSLRWPEFAKLKVTLPPMPEQQRVVEVIEAAQEAVTLAEQQLQALQQQKRALLQRLLSGEPA